MEIGEHVVPGRSRLHREQLVSPIERHLLEIAGVNHERIREERLTAHAVARARDRELQTIVARKRDDLSQRLLVGWFRDAVNGCPVQAARIIDGAALLGKGDWWFDDLQRRSGGRSGKPRIRGTVLLSGRSGRVLVDLQPGGNAQRQQKKDDADGDPPP